MIGKWAAVLGLSLGAIAATPSAASIINQTAIVHPSYDNLSFLDSFDTSLGTLKSVTIDADWTTKSTVNCCVPINDPGGAINRYLTLTSPAGTLTVNGSGFINPVFGDGTTSVNYYSHAVGEAVFNTAADLAVFTTGQPLSTLTDGFLDPKAQQLFGRLFPADATIKVAYDFTPASAVPEPGTWAMMALGIGMAGFLIRRQANKGAAGGLATA